MHPEAGPPRPEVYPDVSGSPVPQGPSSLQKIIPFLGIIASVICGGLWALYTTLRIGQNEPVDCLTPIIMVMFPAGLWIFSQQLDRILDPLFVIRDTLPRPLLVGAAFALPLVLGVICGSITRAGYGAMRWTVVISILGAYVLTRKRQVQG